jgi:hypothetical protein
MAGFCLCVLVAVYVAWSSALLGAIAKVRGFAAPSLHVSLPLLWFSIVILVAIHEVGHWVAGRAVGWRGLRFRLGPFALVRVRNGWKIRWIRWDFGGAVTFAPTALAGFRKADSIFTAAGPLASLLFTLACGWIAWYSTNAAVFWLFGTVAQWAWLGALSLVPAGRGLARSDGYWLWQLTRGGKELQRRQRYMLANMSHGTHLRPRDWPRGLMGPVIDGPTPWGDRHDAYLVYIYFMDLGDPDAAFPWLASVLKKWQKTDPPEYALEAAYYAGVCSHDASLAARWLGCAGKDVDPWVRLRAEAAVASAEGRVEASQRLAGVALAKLENELPSGHRDYETARLNDLLQPVPICILAASQ